MLAAIDLQRGENVYIANAVKCRPPGNRTPESAEIATCAPYLRRQIALIRPRLIVLLGRAAANAVLGDIGSLASLRGKTFEYRDADSAEVAIPVVVSYHPAYLLRTLQDKAKAWEDLCRARMLMRAATTSASLSRLTVMAGIVRRAGDKAPGFPVLVFSLSIPVKGNRHAHSFSGYPHPACQPAPRLRLQHFQTGDEAVKSAWSEVINQYQRRADLVPNLVSTVQGYASHEKEVFTQVTQARRRWAVFRQRRNWSMIRPPLPNSSRRRPACPAPCRGCWWSPRIIRN
jgi:uracil-DNA glycosylase family 4